MSGTSSPVVSSADEGIVTAFSRLAAWRSNQAILVSPGRMATVGDVDSLSRTVADRVRAAHVEPGALVCLAAGNGPAFLAGFLALRRAGAAALLVDPQAPPEDRQRAVTSLGAIAVLECVNTWPSSAADFHLTPVASSTGRPSLADVSVVKLTSGSTGVPRGVAMRTEHLLADEAALARTMGLRGDDRLLAAIPLSHSYGFTTLALSALARGLTLVFPADRGPFSSLAAARDLGATVFPTVPAYIQALLKLAPPPAWPEGIRLVISAGAPLPGATAAQFRQAYGQPVHVFYGASECGGICYDREGGAAERGTVGTPVDGVRLSLTPLEPRTIGEGLVTVESPGVGETYVPERDPRLDSGRFETSDVGAWQGGEIALRRRVDRVINVRGRKVDPGEVEQVLAALDGVEEVVVIGIRSEDGRDEIVRAVVACGPSARHTYRDVAAWCRHHLAEHKVPRSVVFVDAIPRTPRGKIDRPALLTLGAPETIPGTAHG
jgi:acyl-coenzyme A synthetase/AMP-(fatty) acid ligase